MERRLRCTIIGLLATGGCHAATLSPTPRGLDSPTAPYGLAGQRTVADLVERFGGVVVDHDAQRRAAMTVHLLRTANESLGRAPRGEFVLLGSTRMEAFSLPDGRIFMTVGLYRRLEHESLLAAVMAHELAHVARGDGLRPAPRTSAARLSRERDTDALAACLLEAADLPASALIELLRMIESEHPEAQCPSRIAALQ
ncbi:MAG: M48 family metalloprotease [Planctomycetota bacterium]